MVLSDLFDIAVRRKDWPKAIDYAQRVHEGFRARLGDDHNVTNIALINWGQVLYESGNTRGAEQRLQPAHEKLAAQVSAQNPQRQLCGFWLAAVRLELGQLDQANQLLDSLDEHALEAAGADGLWGFRLQALRGLLLSRRDEPRAALALLQSAVDGLEQKSAIDSLIYEKARQVLLARSGNTPQGHP